VVRGQGQRTDGRVIEADPESKAPNTALKQYARSSGERPICTIASGGQCRRTAAMRDRGASSRQVVTFRTSHKLDGRDKAAQRIATMYAPMKPGRIWEWSSTAAIPPWADPKVRRAGTQTRICESSCPKSRDSGCIARPGETPNPKATKDYEQEGTCRPPNRLGEKDGKVRRIGEERPLHAAVQ